MYGSPNLRSRRGPQTTDAPKHSRQGQQSTRRTNTPSLKQQAVWIVGALAAFAVFYLTPVSEILTNEVLLPLVPLESDYEMGRQALHELSYKEVYHSPWTPVLKSVSQDLIRTLGTGAHSNYVWDVAIVRSDDINAFALPGGVIRVTDKLLDVVQPTRGELAALVGHEMGHVIHRHSQARILQSKIVSWIVQAFIYDDHDDVQETFGQALGELLAKSAAWLGQQRFSRLDEYQADATSWELLVDASSKYGYNPQSLHSLLNKLWNLERGKADNNDYVMNVVENWSRTHPATKNRLSALEQKWKELPLKEQRRLSRMPV